MDGDDGHGKIVEYIEIYIEIYMNTNRSPWKYMRIQGNCVNKRADFQFSGKAVLKSIEGVGWLQPRACSH